MTRFPVTNKRRRVSEGKLVAGPLAVSEGKERKNGGREGRMDRRKEGRAGCLQERKLNQARA